MTLQEILSGPVTERLNGSAHPMTESEARGILVVMEKNMPRKRRGPAARFLAENARQGKLSPDAVKLYRAFAVAYGA